MKDLAQDVVQLAIPNLKNNNLDIKKTEKSFSLESYRLRNKWQMLEIYDLTTAQTPCLSPLDFRNIECYLIFFQFQNIKFKRLKKQFEFEIDFCRLHRQ